MLGLESEKPRFELSRVGFQFLDMPALVMHLLAQLVGQGRELSGMALELGRVRPLLPELLGELFRMALEFGRVLRLLPELLGQLPRMTLQFRDMEVL